jgi:spore germination cell wall hydrolase CwlJ-like protein
MLPIAVAVALLAFGLPRPAEAGSSTPDSKERFDPDKVVMMLSYAELRCLALNVYHEARGETPLGMLAVAKVTLNRVGDSRFADTVCGVVHQAGRDGSCQFNWACKANLRDPREGEAWQAAQMAAIRAVSGAPDPTRGAQYFTQMTLRPDWARHKIAPVIIDSHVFFRLAEPGEQVAGSHFR